MSLWNRHLVAVAAAAAAQRGHPIMQTQMQKKPSTTLKQLDSLPCHRYRWTASLHRTVSTEVERQSLFSIYEKQVAQLSQRDRASLHVIEYFAKSLKITRNDTV